MSKNNKPDKEAAHNPSKRHCSVGGIVMFLGMLVGGSAHHRRDVAVATVVLNLLNIVPMFVGLSRNRRLLLLLLWRWLACDRFFPRLVRNVKLRQMARRHDRGEDPSRLVGDRHVQGRPLRRVGGHANQQQLSLWLTGWLLRLVVVMMILDIIMFLLAFVFR
jgi:hypothetical protein